MLALDVSPLAGFLVGLADRRATGIVTLVERAVSLVHGELSDVGSAEGDPSYAEFLLQSERLSAQALAELQEQARSGVAFATALTRSGKLTAHEHRKLQRALWLDRFVRELRRALARPKLLPTLDVTQSTLAPAVQPWPLLPFVLDAWTRLAALGDAAAVGMRIDYRLQWVDGPMLADAQRWASFGVTPERPVIASVLGRLPAATSEIAALARLGFVRLVAPGGDTARPRSMKQTLPPPAPRLSSLAAAPSEPPASIIVLEPELPSDGPTPRARPAHHLFQPGEGGWDVEALPVVELARWPQARGPLADPLRELELEIARLEQQEADGKQRARAFVRLAALWQSRIGSLEHATRALREAAAADPEDAQLLLQTARQCAALGQVELARAYARAVAFGAETPAERAAGHRALANLHAALGDTARELEALSEAAAEDPEDPEPHERLAQLQLDRGHLQLAAAHARRVARGRAGVVRDRELGWASIAYAWDPGTTATAEAYRDALAASGLAAAAIAVGRHAARAEPDAAARARLLLAAAELARNHGQLPLAAELLLERFDEDPLGAAPHYRALDEASAGPEPSYEHAAVLESVARACPPDQRADWYARCAEQLAQLPDQAAAAEHARELARAYRTLPVSEDDASARQREEVMARLRLVADSGSEHEHALFALAAALQLQAGELRQAIRCALRALALVPDDHASAARLWRATALLPEPVLQREALTLLARVQRDGPRARTLALLARKLEQLAEFDAAVEAADAALAAESSSADAALIVMRHAHRLPPPRAAVLLEHGLRLFGSCPPLASVLAQALIASGEREQALAVLERCSERLPTWLEAQNMSLELRMEQGAPGALAAAALRLLIHSPEPIAIGHVEQVVVRLLELGTPELAARLALQCLDARCRVDLAHATAAAELARRADRRELLIQALERVASSMPGSAQLPSLVAIAAHHARSGDRVGEVRAWLRVLALVPSHAQALESLTRAFAESGDAARLLVVLTMSLEGSRTPRERRERWLALASAAARVGQDRDKAAQYVAALVLESKDDPSALRHAIGALFSLGDGGWATRKARELAGTLPPEAAGAVFLWLAQRAETVAHDPALALELAAFGARHFPQVGGLLLAAERLCLDARDRESAVALYRDLSAAATGEHGRRALAYRAGRWLERNGSFEDALTYYTEAFELARTSGVAYQALARVARSAKKLAPLVSAQESLAELATDDRARLGLLREAARTSVHDMDDPERGFRNLLKADALAGVGELDPQLNELWARLGARDDGARERAVRELAELREARAEQLWEAPDKAKLLLNAARLHLHERGDPKASLETLAPLLTQEAREELPPELRADSLLTLAEAELGSGQSERALDAVEELLSVMPGDLNGLKLRVRLSARPPSAAAPAAPVKRQPTQPAALDAASLQLDLVSSHAVAQQAITARAPGPEPSDAQHASLEHEAATTRPPAAQGGEPPTASVELRSVREDALDLSTLRKLFARARTAPEAQLAGQILSLFDPAIARPSGGAPAERLLPEQAWQFVHEDPDREVQELLTLVWETVRSMPLLRRSPEDFGVDAGDDARATSPLRERFDAIARLLGGTEVELRVLDPAEPELRLLATTPPCVLAARELDPTPVHVFQLARLLVLAEPAHALTCVLVEDDGRDLLAALLGAFGAPGSTAEPTERANDLASQLWHALPARGQGRLRELVRAREGALDYARLRQQAERCALRAGLLAVGDLRVAIESLALLEPEPCDVHTALGFQAAYARSSALRELIHSAFSDAYLALASPALRHRSA